MEEGNLGKLSSLRFMPGISLRFALCAALVALLYTFNGHAEEAPTIASAGAPEPASTVKAPPPVAAPVYTEPFPAPKQAGTPSQPAESIALYESFDGVASKTNGVLGAGWLPRNSEGLPLSYPLSDAFKKNVTALSIEWWMKREIGSSPPNGTLIHGPGFKVSFGWNQSPHGTMHIKFQQAKQGAWIGNAGPEIPLGPSDGQWHYYVATFDLHEIAVYLDGEIYSRDWQGNNAEQIGPMCDGANDIDRTAIQLGGNAPGRWPDQAFTGVPVDEVLVFHRGAQRAAGPPELRECAHHSNNRLTSLQMRKTAATARLNTRSR